MLASRFARRAALASAVATLAGLSLPALHAAASPSRGGRADLLARTGGHASLVRDGVSAIYAVAAGYRTTRPDGISANESPGAAARAWTTRYAPALGTTGADLVVTRSALLRGGDTVARLGQTVSGLPVFGGGVTVALDSSNRLLSVASRLSRVRSVDTTARISAGEAARLAVAKVHREGGGASLQPGTATLQVLDQAVLGGPVDGPPTLAWVVPVSSPDRQVRHTVLVEADTGAIAVDLDDNSAAERVVVCSAGNGNVPQTDPTCSPDGTGNPIVADSNGKPAAAPGASGYDADTYNAYRFAQAVDDFYSTLFNRAGLDGKGSPLTSTVHFCEADPDPTQNACPMQNAFWDGAEMVYGEGFASALDVVGHEMTHGLTQYTSNLNDYYQSGAIDESVSDVMGEFIQQIEGPIIAPGDPTVYDPSKRWLMGEDLPSSVTGPYGGFIRDLADPTLDNPAYGSTPAEPDPDRVTSPYYSAAPAYDSAWDEGGVHNNDGIDNKAAFLMTDGGTFNGVTLTGMSSSAAATTAAQSVVERDVKTANVYYRVEQLMLSSTDFADLAKLLPAACNQLVGQRLPLPAPFAAGATTALTAGDCHQVTLATTATAMSSAPTAPGAVVPTPATVSCTNGGAPTRLALSSFDSASPFDTGYSRGTDGSRTEYGQWWWSQEPITDYGPDGTTPTYAASGTGALWGDDADPTYFDAAANPSDHEDAYAATPAMTVRPGTFLNFKQAWEFDYGPASATSATVYNFDGGVVEYSRDGGPWKDAAALFTGGRYNGTISDTNNVFYPGYVDPNPLAGRRGYVGSSHGWTASRLDLSSLAGSSVRLRWRIGADDSVGTLGWYIDDVTAYSCNPTTLSLAAPGTVRRGHAATLSARLTRTGTATGLGGQPVQLYSRRHGSSAWHALGAARRTGSSGSVRWTVRPKVATDYQARFAHRPLAPSRSATRTVRLR